MKSNSKVVREQICHHILDCVYDEFGENYDTIQLAATSLYNEFDIVSNYPANLQRYPNPQQRFKDYMQGLPFNFLIYYRELTEFLNGLGINPDNKEYDTEQTENLYYNLIYREMLKHKSV